MAAKIIENVTSTTGRYCKKFINNDVGLVSKATFAVEIIVYCSEPKYYLFTYTPGINFLAFTLSVIVMLSERMRAGGHSEYS